GFTLVEMGIVVAIIGILLAGILYAEELYRIVQVRRVMADINGISAATKGFQDKYGSVPGDFPLATTRIANCNATSFCRNGNGDGFVGQVFAGDSGWDKDQSASYGGVQSYETTQFFKHLAWGHFIKDVNPMANPANPQWSSTNPAAATGGGFTVFADTQ